MSLQLLKSTVVVSSMTFISRILGFIREMVAAHFFGASSAYDAFIIASKIPNFMRRLFAEGAFSQAFVPMLSEYRTIRSQAEVHLFINKVGGALSVVLLAVTLLGILCSSFFIFIFAPGFAVTDGGLRLEIASVLLKITFPYLFFVSLTAFAGGILNTYGKFAVPAFTPVLLNIMIIFFAVCVSPFLTEPVMALAWGTFFGGLVQLLFQIPYLKKIHLLPRLQIDWRDKGVRRILLLMVPALLGVSVNQLNLMLSSMFASFLPSGSISWLYYAERLMEFPLGGFGIALATVVLPKLSQQHTRAEKNAFSSTLDWGIRWVLLIGFPAALGLGLLAGPLLTTLFQSGKFTERDVIFSAPCLVAYSIGIMGFLLMRMFSSAYYAKQDIKTPVRIAIVTVIINFILCFIFISGSIKSHHFFTQTPILKWLLLPIQMVSDLNIPIYGPTGLALATSLAAIFNALLLGIGLIKRGIYQIQPGWGLLLLRLTMALGVMTFSILYFNPTLEEWFLFPRLKQILVLISLMTAATLAYVMTLFATGLRVRHVLFGETRDAA